MHKQTHSFRKPTNDMAGHLPAAELKTCIQEAEIATPRHGTPSDASIAYLRRLLLPSPWSALEAVLRVTPRPQPPTRVPCQAPLQCCACRLSTAAETPHRALAALPTPVVQLRMGAPEAPHCLCQHLAPTLLGLQLLVNTLLPHPAPSHAARNTELLSIQCSLCAAPPLNTTCVCGYQRELEQMQQGPTDPRYVQPSASMGAIMQACITPLYIRRVFIVRTAWLRRETLQAAAARLQRIPGAD